MGGGALSNKSEESWPASKGHKIRTKTNSCVFMGGTESFLHLTQSAAVARGGRALKLREPLATRLGATRSKLYWRNPPNCTWKPSGSSIWILVFASPCTILRLRRFSS